MLNDPSCDTDTTSKQHYEGEIMTNSIFALKNKVKKINQQISALEWVEADRADVDELIHERTEVQWQIVALISSAK